MLMLPHVPSSFINLTVQVIATIFVAAAVLFPLALYNDRSLVGERVNALLRSAVSIAVMVLLIVCTGV